MYREMDTTLPKPEVGEVQPSHKIRSLNQILEIALYKKVNECSSAEAVASVNTSEYQRRMGKGYLIASCVFLGLTVVSPFFLIPAFGYWSLSNRRYKRAEQMEGSYDRGNRWSLGDLLGDLVRSQYRKWRYGY